MCGIVGLFSKNADVAENLGTYFSEMLDTMGQRGPDSAGFAIYRNDKSNEDLNLKICLYHNNSEFVWDEFIDRYREDLACEFNQDIIQNHLLLTTNCDLKAFTQWLNTTFPEIKVMSAGEKIEIYKEKGFPTEVANRFNLNKLTGSHAIGHTRMATESAITTAHSHPFSTGLDICLVHNGSLSNHHKLRRFLTRNNISFQSDNDSEVASGYLSYLLSNGHSLKEALELSIDQLDGFYTFAVGTKNGFAVLRDPIACKPAVLAETDDWVAMASEFRALAHLPGIDDAEIWEPAPATVYSWELN